MFVLLCLSHTRITILACDNPTDDDRRMIDLSQRVDESKNILPAMTDVSDIQNEILQTILLFEQRRVGVIESLFDPIGDNGNL